jgi:hypothetical protein
MEDLVKLKSLLLSTTLLATTLLANTIFANHDNYLPVARFILTPELKSEDLGVSFLGEVGPRTYRANGTVGYAYHGNQRIKLSGEYLKDKLKYNFHHDESSRKWVEQWAVGADYEYLVSYGCIDTFNMGGAYSDAQSKHLNNVLLNNGRLQRNIAGSHYWDVNIGTSFTPWKGGSINFDLVYDQVKYKRRFHHHKTIRGVGAEIALTQNLFQGIDFSIHGAVRRPYREIGALLTWDNPTKWKGLGLGLFVDYVQGRSHLPDETTFGIQFAYHFGQSSCKPAESACCPGPRSFHSWIAKPSVYRPTVFAVAEHETLRPLTNQAANPSVSSSSENLNPPPQLLVFSVGDFDIVQPVPAVKPPKVSVPSFVSFSEEVGSLPANQEGVIPTFIDILNTWIERW